MIQWRLVIGICVAGCLPLLAMVLWSSYKAFDTEPSVLAAPVPLRRARPETSQAASSTPTSRHTPVDQGSAGSAGNPSDDTTGTIKVGVAYGTEKKYWFQNALTEFQKTPAGARIRIDLIPMGSLESAHAIVDKDERIHVWAPASQLYHDIFILDWEARYRGNPIARSEILALTPMVIVMWRERFDAFVAKAPEVSLRNIYFAMRADTGWKKIAGRPEWGLFKFGHTHPGQSNSGLMTLILLAYDYHSKTSGLTMGDIMTSSFQTYLGEFARGASGMSNSTGNMMNEMVYKGPESYDALMVYESVAIDYLKKAEESWGALHVAYPKYNMWSDNPYYILDTPWTTKAHQEAAAEFLEFLLSAPIQTMALDHGFRPGNPTVPIQFPKSPFVVYADRGLKVELPTVCSPPPARVIENLQQSWLRQTGPR